MITWPENAPKLSDEARFELHRLSSFLRDLPAEKMSMRFYFKESFTTFGQRYSSLSVNEYLNDCGSTACVLGWLTLLTNRKHVNDTVDELIPNIVRTYDSGKFTYWEFLFSDRWPDCPIAAADRVDYLLSLPVKEE